ncbi:MAG: YbfB/YjiJ family MFS transporter [Solibacillus sp.]|uniref:YbfB/YjiJ family MFS transporter n=1 Tax=Solibacillus sp. TaxID=1909654 RepID=UPI0033155699
MKIVFGGVLLLAVAMGIGRFAYTPMLPFMQESLNWTNSTAGFIALSNYVGYFIGALLCTFSFFRNKQLSIFIMIWISAISTLLLGFTENIMLIFIGRFVSGLTSAVIFIFTSQIILTYIQSIQKNGYAGYLYSGVGFGIVGSSILLMLFSPILDWNEIWRILGIASLIMGLIGYSIIRMLPIDSTKSKGKVNNTATIYWLYLAYFLEGLGYIITGTFIVNVAKNSSTIHFDSTLVWLIVGIAAIPSCFLLIRLAEQFGYSKVLSIVLLLQSIGIVLPALNVTNWSFIISAFLFGFTFMGITALANAIVKKINTSAIGTLTALYALGQIIGPAIAGILLDSKHFSSAFLFAGITVLTASLCVVFYSIRERRFNLNVR